MCRGEKGGKMLGLEQNIIKRHHIFSFDPRSECNTYIHSLTHGYTQAHSNPIQFNSPQLPHHPPASFLPLLLTHSNMMTSQRPLVIIPIRPKIEIAILMVTVHDRRNGRLPGHSRSTIV